MFAYNYQDVSGNFALTHFRYFTTYFLQYLFSFIGTKQKSLEERISILCNYVFDSIVKIMIYRRLNLLSV